MVLTWINAVAMMTPVPNCFSRMKIPWNLSGNNGLRKMGSATPEHFEISYCAARYAWDLVDLPMKLVASITKTRPILSGML